MKRILVIQQKMIGDVLTSTFLCEVIKRNDTNVVVDYLINEHTLPVVQNNPYIDNIIILTKNHQKNILSLLSFVSQNIKNNYDVVIDAYGKIQSNLISLFSGAKEKITYKKWYTSWMYSKTVITGLYSSNAALYDRLCLLKPLFDKELDILKPKIYLSEKEVQQGKDFLNKNRFTAHDAVFMISVLGSNQQKTYPPKYMAKVIDYLAQHTQAKFLFNYIPSQKEAAKQVYDLCEIQTQQRIIFDAYTTSLRSFLMVLSHCTALIGNEGGAVNMAKGLNIPTFSIYSPQVAKGAWDTFSDDKNVAVHLRDFTPELFEQKFDNLALYSQFNFQFFEKILSNFLKTINHYD